MFTILGADGKEYGPVSTAKIREWISEGRINLSTKAKRMDEGACKALGDFVEFSVPSTDPPVLEGTSSPTPFPTQPSRSVDAKAYAAELIARSAPLGIIGCIERSFELWKANFLPLVGVTFVVFLLAGALGAIPVLGAIANAVLNGVFYGGLYYYYLGKMRGEPREFSDAFAGFSKAFGPLSLASVLMVILAAVAACVLIVPWVVFLIMAGQQWQQHLGLILGLFVFMLPIIYLSTSWTFTFALVIDQRLSPWTAMEVSRRVITKQWFRMFFTLLLAGILALLGLVGLIIGVVFTLPLAVGAVLYAYEDLCNPPPTIPAESMTSNR